MSLSKKVTCFFWHGGCKPGYYIDSILAAETFTNLKNSYIHILSMKIRNKNFEVRNCSMQFTRN